MKKAWLIAGAVVAFVIAVWLASRGDKKGAARVRADATENLAKPAIEKAQRRLAKLNEADEQDATEARKIKARIERRKEKLREKFKSQGLAAADITARFRRLRV